MPCCQLTALNCVWSVIENEHSYISSQKEKRNSLFPCIQVKNSLADFIISTVFLKGCFILLGEQKEQNNSLPLRSSQHLLRGSPNYHYWNWKCLPNLCPGRWGEDIQGFIHTKSSSNQAGPLPLNRSTGKWARWEGASSCCSYTGCQGSSLVQCPVMDTSAMWATESMPSSGSCEVFTVGRKNLFSTSAGPNGGGQKGMGVKKHLWLHWG